MLGTEVAGTVAAVGDGVTELSVDDRVATAAASGAYAEFSTAPAQFVAHVPSEIGLDVAASALLKGSTAHYLITSVYAVQPGDAVLVHAGAGGVGTDPDAVADASGRSGDHDGVDAGEGRAVAAGRRHRRPGLPGRRSG